MKRKYKVIVYAIAKNEESFVDRWVDSMSEADEIYVLLQYSIKFLLFHSNLFLQLFLVAFFCVM